MASRLPIGGLLLEAAEGWSFSLRDGVIAGKRGTQPGVLRIITLAPNQVPQPATHEVCLRLAVDRFAIKSDRPTDVHLVQSATGPFGSACYRERKDLVCVWYCTRPAGLILGALACPAALAKAPDFKFTRAQCARMIGSAIFNRAEWGASDELSNFVTTEILQLEPPEAGGGGGDEAVPPGPEDKPAPGRPPKSGGSGRSRG
jgi:hypothetical protein